MFRETVAALAAVSALSGCAIHPLPEDVTGIGTYDIVRQIRCEARESIKGIVLGFVGNLAQSGDPIAQKLAARYAAEPEAINTFHPSLFAGPRYIQVQMPSTYFTTPASPIPST